MRRIKYLLFIIIGSMYRPNIKRTLDPKTCPFCNERNKLTQVVKEYKHFVIFQNEYPYTDNHVMLIPKRHIHSELDFTPTERADFRKIHEYMVDTYISTFGSCFSFARENTPKQSVWHFHKHYIPNDDCFGRAKRVVKKDLSVSF